MKRQTMNRAEIARVANSRFAPRAWWRTEAGPKRRQRAATTSADTWVEGYFYDDTKSKDKRALTVHDLDLVSRDLPVVVIHRGGHTAFYNSKAFKMAGVSKSTPNPPGDTCDCDPNGELTGRVTENARTRIDAVGKRRQYSGEEALRRDRDGLAYISKQFVRFGLTAENFAADVTCDYQRLDRWKINKFEGGTGIAEEN